MKFALLLLLLLFIFVLVIGVCSLCLRTSTIRGHHQRPWEYIVRAWQIQHNAQSGLKRWLVLYHMLDLSECNSLHCKAVMHLCY